MYSFSDVKKNLDTFVQFGHDIQLIASHLESFIYLCWSMVDCCLILENHSSEIKFKGFLPTQLIVCKLYTLVEVMKHAL